MLAAQIWRRNSNQVSHMLVAPQPIRRLELDPLHQTADVDHSNNSYPQQIMPSRIELYKRESKDQDLMKAMLAKLKTADDAPAQDKTVPLETPQ